MQLETKDDINTDSTLNTNQNNDLDNTAHQYPQKKRIVFAFIEAGLGHIMPMRATCEVFKEKYGDKCEVIESYFLREEGNEALNWLADEKVKEVKKVNKNKPLGTIQHVFMNIVGNKITTTWLHKSYWKKAYKDAVNRAASYNADLIFNTYFSTLYYAAEAKMLGLTNAKIVTFCPDPHVGVQWDRRGDIMALSAASGVKTESKKARYKKGLSKAVEVPFLIRKEIADYTLTRNEYKEMLGIPKDKFTVLLADGAYGAAKLKNTVYELLKLKAPIAIIAACGRNEELYQEFLNIVPPSHIDFRPFGFTDKMLQFAATSDLLVGRSAASMIAESAYFGSPAIITRTSTGVEKWICDYHAKKVKSALKITNIKQIAKAVDKFAQNPNTLYPFIKATKIYHRTDGAEKMADILWQELNS